MNVQKVYVGVLATGVVALAVDIVGTIQERKTYKELKASYDQNLDNIEELQRNCTVLVEEYKDLQDVVNDATKILRTINDMEKENGSVLDRPFFFHSHVLHSAL